jgi:hypothetical protein
MTVKEVRMTVKEGLSENDGDGKPHRECGSAMTPPRTTS